MELLLNQELEFVPEPTEVSYSSNNGILNSNYKSVVKQNFSKSTTKSVFGIRQRLKSSQFNMVNHTAVILKLSAFAIVLVALF
ncbi:hypothetical protein [Winogradskyella sp. PG-2]|uniref:hypothetical protein n=1 Tax=Winogradskyella sp. PG-2 TaxID=754409 RepID=UPI0004586252|nr:hypothetical protein [Winogradskyella sp. PG-2]BAO76227.1 hypothetical protein WPG_1997 [Winogradskyella sp. PG-2]